MVRGMWFSNLLKQSVCRWKDRDEDVRHQGWSDHIIVPPKIPRAIPRIDDVHNDDSPTNNRLHVPV